MVDKCSKCGADLSADAEFCPLCGTKKVAQPVQPEQPAPVQPEPVQQQPAQTQPTAVSPPPPKPVKTGGGAQGFIDLIFSKMLLTIGVGICFLVAWIAKLIMQFIDQWEYSLGGITSQTTAFTAMYVLNFTFMAAAGLLLFGAGFLYKKYNTYIRIGLIVAGAVVLSTSI